MASSFVGCFAAVGLLAAGCTVWSGGLGSGDDSQPIPVPVDRRIDAGSTFGTVLISESPDGGTRVRAGGGPARASVSGIPATVGCADGSREGFLDVEAWSKIAGCAGGWSVPGVLSRPAHEPQCNHESGNTGLNPAGIGCSVADLCAEGWHVCIDGDDLARHSPSDCESASPSAWPQFFLSRAAATVDGACLRSPLLTNDLHGCGSLGQPAGESCPPFERRFTLADCAASAGAWSCGSAADPFNEANLVVKAGSEQGGVLCCQGP